eukprot:CAMPEP_0113874464 /NCGR_PEP_ID=MMETSP0780_2-20120614/4349_1 /TAXON_ID=652834 /ORGANISM="Palpitomonas bilix" /LENGTH=551 /DNA_ID=CAMNT_0000860241 /DNA_START=138 /DNA_END=1793 /DNA_ORIENTATION=+ /assembly_acc=CAM_ASM_000599
MASTRRPSDGSNGKAEELQKKLRRAESDKKAYQDESNNTLRQQKLAITSLREENERLKEDLSMETKQSLVGSAIAGTEGLSRLQDQADSFTQKVEYEKKKIEDMEKELRDIQKKTLEQRQKMGGVNAVRDANKALDKQIKVLENRLDKSLVKFNESLAQNKRLRDEIDNLRRERVIFDGVYRKLEKELQENKKEMANIVETSNIAYEARDQAHHEMNVLRAMADKEQMAFEAEWRELGKQIEDEKKQRESVHSKDGRGELGTEEEGKLKKKIAKGAWNIAKDRAMQQSAVEKVRSYEEAFERIKEATGIADIDELVTTFIEAEDQNYALFNYVNELNSEIEKMDEQILEVQSDIDKYKGQGAETENQRKKILKELEERLEKTTARVEYYRARSEASQKTIDTLKSGIQSLFYRIGCNTPTAKELLGEFGVEDANMMQYLGVIEQRTNEVIHAFVTAQLQNGSAKESVSDQAAAQGALQTVLGSGPSVPSGAAVVTVEPPAGTGENDSDNESDEDDERPLSREELKARTLQSITKRDGKGGQAQKKPSKKRA